MNEDDKKEAGTGPETREYASPPCFIHELDDDYFDVASWRKETRKHLITERLAIPSDVRKEFSGLIAANLDRVFSDISGLTISSFWPFKGEPDLRDWMERVHHLGGICALPCVVEPKSPMCFRIWEPGMEMERGIWNIPVPPGDNEVVPDIVIAPVVGFDEACFRLGYGGGYFDRTIAAMLPRPRVIGVGFECARIPKIHPHQFDIPMDIIVTEQGIFRVPSV